MKRLVESWLERRRSRRRQEQKVRAERKALIAALHVSAQWDCDCWMHRAARQAAVTKLQLGLSSESRKLFGFIPMETVRFSKEEKDES